MNLIAKTDNHKTKQIIITIVLVRKACAKLFVLVSVVSFQLEQDQWTINRSTT